MEYSAGLTSKLFWLQESRKTAAYILEGLSKADIRKIADVYKRQVYIRFRKIIMRKSSAEVDILFASCSEIESNHLIFS